jgi:hypothetical protein
MPSAIRRALIRRLKDTNASTNAFLASLAAQPWTISRSILMIVGRRAAIRVKLA